MTTALPPFLLPLRLLPLRLLPAAALALALAGCATPATTTGAAPSLASPSPSSSAMTLPATGQANALPSAPPRSPLLLAGVGPLLAERDTPAIAVDPLHPTEQLDLDAAAAQTDLWARVRQGTAMPELDNELVRKWEQWYAGKPDYVQRMTERGGRYLFHIIEELNKRGMPTELALLPFIESAFNPQAMSTAKASGMWQFVPATGRDFALRQNMFRDDRREVLASTRAALDYLNTLHGMFGDWQLALAAYNWGQGNVQRAIKRNLAAGLSTDYDSLQMPAETRNYLPKLQAVKNIVMRPDAFGVKLPALQNHPYFVSVALKKDIDTDLAARLAGLPLEEFKQLNPQMNKPVILSAVTPQVLLPFDSAARFVHALSQHRGGLASWTAWVAPRTMKTAEAARQVGMTEAQLSSLNGIPKRMLVKTGSTLLVARTAHRVDDVSQRVAEDATLALAPDVPPLKRVSFKAGRKGDSVMAVAGRYRVKATEVAAWNSTTAAARFKPGQVVVVMVPNKPLRLASRDGRKGGHAKRSRQTASLTPASRG